MLPSAPKTYVALNAAMAAPTCSVTTLAQIIERDVGLCAKLLQLVNSAFFGLPKRISSLNDTVSYLGFTTIKNLALALETFSSAAKTSGLSEAKLRRSRPTPFSPARLHTNRGEASSKRAEGAFLAGVLHDVGCLLNVKNNQTRTPARRSSVPSSAPIFSDLWGLPHPIMEAVAYHKEPHLIAHSTFELVDIIYIADHLATELRGDGTDDQKLNLDYLCRYRHRRNPARGHARDGGKDGGDNPWGFGKDNGESGEEQT